MTHSRTRFGVAALALLALVVPSSIAVSQAAIAASPNEVTFGMTLLAWNDEDYEDDEDYEEMVDVNDVTVHLYLRGEDGYTEVDTAVSDPQATVEGIVAGDYRLRFSKGNSWIGVFDGYDFNDDESYPETTDACSYDFDRKRLGDVLDLEIYLTGTTGSNDCGAEGTAGVVSGAVTGIPVGESATASLYRVETYTDEDEDYYDFDWRGSVDVAADGTYSLPSVYRTGKYTVAIDPQTEKSRFFTTFYGDLYESYSSEATIVKSAFPVAAGKSTANRDIAVKAAAILHGTVTAAGKPLANAYVTAIDLDDEEGFDGFGASTDKNGEYELAVPVDVQVVVGAYSPGYSTEYFDNVTDPMFAERITATTGGDFPRAIDFSLEDAPVYLLGVILKYDGKRADPFSGVDVYLSRLTDHGWKAAGHQKVQKIQGATYVAFPKGLLKGETASLKPGTYRLKFKKNDRWIPVRESIVVAEKGTFKQGSRSCSVKLGTLDRGAVVASIGLDPNLSKPNCNSSAAGGVAPGAGVAKPSVTGTETPTPTPTPTATPTATPSPTATPTPAATTEPVEPTATPSAEPTADGAIEPVNSTTLLIGGGILALLVLGAAAFFIFRRRA